MLALSQRMRASVAPAVASRSSAFMATPVAVRPAVVAPVKAAAPTTVTVEAKIKTRKAAAKRFRVTGSGKLVARRSCKQHFNEKMDRDTKRRLSKMFVLEPANVPNAIKCLPNHSIGQ